MSKIDFEDYIKPLVQFCVEKPYSFSFFAEKRPEKAQKRYLILVRKMRESELEDSQIARITEAKIGGAFGFASEDSAYIEVLKKYVRNEKNAIQIFRKFKTMEELKRRYTEHLLGKKPLKQMDLYLLEELPLVRYFDFENSPNYIKLIYKILDLNIGTDIRIFDVGYKELLDQILRDNFSIDQQNVIKANCGLEDEQPLKPREIASKYNYDIKFVYNTTDAMTSKLKNYINEISRFIYKPSTEFLSEFIKKHGVLEPKGGFQISEEKRKELIDDLRRKKQEELDKTRKRITSETRIEEIQGLKKTIIDILHSKRINVYTLGDIAKFESEASFRKAVGKKLSDKALGIIKKALNDAGLEFGTKQQSKEEQELSDTKRIYRKLNIECLGFFEIVNKMLQQKGINTIGDFLEKITSLEELKMYVGNNKKLLKHIMQILYINGINIQGEQIVKETNSTESGAKVELIKALQSNYLEVLISIEGLEEQKEEVKDKNPESVTRKLKEQGETIKKLDSLIASAKKLAERMEAQIKKIRADVIKSCKE